MDRLRVAVAGGSIGGLTAAVLLHELGCDVNVFERAGKELEDRGAGIVVLPMTERYFVERGGDDDRVSLKLPWWTYVDGSGNTLARDLDNFRFGSWNGVYRALLDAFPQDRYHLDSELVDIERHDESATLVLADGTRVDADLVVCADGVASTARRILLPGVEPVYVGYVAWRGTAAESALQPGTIELVRDAMVYQVLDGGHILVYAIPGAAGSLVAGERIQNFVWYRNYPDAGPYQAVMTDTEGVVRASSVPPGSVRSEHLKELHRESTALAPQLRDIVMASQAPFVQAIFDLEVPRMVFGRVCIMGDAAFAARPHVAAGTAKAAADAWALRDALRDTGGEVASALASWEPRQLGLGRSVVERSRRMGVRSQFEGSMRPGDPSWKFGLQAAGT